MDEGRELEGEREQGLEHRHLVQERPWRECKKKNQKCVCAGWGGHPKDAPQTCDEEESRKSMRVILGETPSSRGYRA